MENSPKTEVKHMVIGYTKFVESPVCYQEAQNFCYRQESKD